MDGIKRWRDANEKPRDGCAGLRVSHWSGFRAPRYRDAWPVVTTGFKVTLQEDSSINYPPCRLLTSPGLPAGITAARYAPQPLPPALVTRPGIPLKHGVEGGRRRLASGTPATRGAHNSKTPRPQPDQSLVREPIPNRITAAIPVNAFRGCASTVIAG